MDSQVDKLSIKKILQPVLSQNGCTDHKMKELYIYVHIYIHTQAGEYVLLIWIEASRFSTNSLKHDIGLE